MQRARFAVPVLLLWVPVALAAQGGPIVTEGELLAAVAEGHPAVVALVGERDVAAAEVLRAGLLPNPAVEATVEEPGGGLRETTAGVAWTPPLDGRRALRREVAQRGLSAAESRVAAARLRLRLDLRRAYAGWAFAWERRELLAAHLARIGELAARARARAEAGEIPGLAARRFTLEEAQERADLGRAEARLAAARAEVAAWYPALPADARPAPPPLPAGPAALPDLAGRPDLVAREREVERAEALRRLAGRVNEAPTFGLGWKRVEERAAESSGPVVSVGWTLPLFDRRQADRLEAEARLTTARADLELARTRAEAERAGAAAALERLRAEASGAAQAAKAAEEALAGAEAAYRLGEAGLTDFLDTLRSALEARATALEIREAVAAAERELEAAAGRPLDPTSSPGDLP
jgi:outer membrane protein, heavy metal efflux system